MEPKQEAVAGKFFFKYKTLIVILVGISAVTTLLYFVVPRIKNQPAPVLKTQKILSPETEMEKSVKLAFTSAQDGNIIKFINLAAEEDNSNTKYLYYSKAFKGMVSSYSNLKTAERAQAMQSLKNFAKGLSGYKEGDFVVPK